MARQIKIPQFIHRHPVATLVADQRFVRQRTVSQDVVTPGAVAPDVRGKQLFAVGGTADAVGLDEILDDGF